MQGIAAAYGVDSNYPGCDAQQILLSSQLFPAPRCARFNFMVDSNYPGCDAQQILLSSQLFPAPRCARFNFIHTTTLSTSVHEIAAAARLESLDSAFRTVDEIGSTMDFRAHPRHESVSTKPYGEDERHVNPDSRMDAMERSLADMARAIREMRINQPDQPAPRSGRDRHWSERAAFPRSPAREEDFVREFLAKEKMDIPNYDGKQYAGDIFITRLIPKPYMFVKKLSSASLKKKQDYRPNITANEYVNAFIAMLCDHRARDPADLLHQLRHLHDVSTDALTRPWVNVRDWSQSVFDEIEKGNLAWSDTSQIQFARCQTSFMGSAAATPEASDKPIQSQNGHYTREVICTDYNNRSCTFGGKFKHHVENGVRFTHACLYCYASTGAKRDHPLNDPCNFRIRDRSGASQLYHHTAQNPTYQHPNAVQNLPPQQSRYRQFNNTQYTNQQPTAPQPPKNQ